jgi:putative transposase
VKTRTYTPEQIVRLLRQIEAGQAEGKAVEETCRALAIGESTYRRWKSRYGGMKTDEVRRPKELAEGERAAQEARRRPVPGQPDPQGGRSGEPTCPARCRGVVGRLCKDLNLSQRRVCEALGVTRSLARLPDKGGGPVARMHELAKENPRYGYRRVAALLRAEGWRVDDERARRPWRQQGLKIPKEVKKERRLGRGGNGCTRRRATRMNEAWSYDSLFGQTAGGRPLKTLPIVGEFARERLVVLVGRRLGAREVIKALAKAATERGMPEHLRSGDGPGFIARGVRRWLAEVEAATPYVEPGSPWGNAYSESLNSRPRDELLNGELLSSEKEAAVLSERHRGVHNEERPHSSLGHVAPAVFARQRAQADQAKASSA